MVWATDISLRRGFVYLVAVADVASRRMLAHRVSITMDRRPRRRLHCRRAMTRSPSYEIVHGDKGYDSNAIRRQVEESGAMRDIPPKASRKWNCFSLFLYHNRNAIERLFCQLGGPPLRRLAL